MPGMVSTLHASSAYDTDWNAGSLGWISGEWNQRRAQRPLLLSVMYGV